MRFCVVLLAFLTANTAMAGDGIDLLGRWDMDKMDTYYLRFDADGNVRIGMPRGLQEGTYRLLEDDGILELTTSDRGRIKVTERKYRLRGDTLEIKFGVTWKKYKRAKKE